MWCSFVRMNHKLLFATKIPKKIPQAFQCGHQDNANIQVSIQKHNIPTALYTEIMTSPVFPLHSVDNITQHL